MTTKANDGGYAFPHPGTPAPLDRLSVYPELGMTLRDWFAGQALSNPALCTGKAAEFYIRKWFGPDRSYSAIEVAAMQAYAHADAMLAARTKAEG